MYGCERHRGCLHGARSSAHAACCMVLLACCTLHISCCLLPRCTFQVTHCRLPCLAATVVSSIRLSAMHLRARHVDCAKEHADRLLEHHRRNRPVPASACARHVCGMCAAWDRTARHRTASHGMASLSKAEAEAEGQGAMGVLARDSRCACEGGWHDARPCPSRSRFRVRAAWVHYSG